MRKGIKALLLTLTVAFGAFAFAGCSLADDDYLNELLCEHQYDEGIITTAPSCIKKGELTITCVKCGKEKTKAVEKQPHNYIAVSEESPTCIKAGYSAHEICTVCGSVKGKTMIPATGHTVVEVEGQAPTCTSVGYSASSYCSTCDAEIIPRTEIEATGHTEVLMVGKPSTCTQAGFTASSYCSTCDEILLALTEVPAGEHNYVVPGGYYTTDNCGICGASNSFTSAIQSQNNYIYTPYNGQDVMGKIIRVKWYKTGTGVNSVFLRSDTTDNPGSILAPGDEKGIIDVGLVEEGKIGSMARSCVKGEYNAIMGCMKTHPKNMKSAQIGDYIYFQFPEIIEYPAFDFFGEITFLSNGVIDERSWGLVEIVSEKLTVEVSSNETNNLLTDNGNGTYNYKFGGDGDFIHNSEIEVDVDETLVCDFSLSINSLTENGWFGVCFGNETYKEMGLVSYPHTVYWMINYNEDSIRLYCGSDVPVISMGDLNISNVLLTGATYNYRITLTKDQDGTYTYALLRKASTENAYTLIHERANIACPTPSCLMLTSVYNTFTLTDVCFYKV